MYFKVTGSWVDGACGCESLIGGSAHRNGRKKLHLGLTGAADADGPGGGAGTHQAGYDVRYNLKKEKGASSYLYLYGGEGWSTEPIPS